MPTVMSFFAGKKVVDVACGESFTVVIAEVEGDPSHKVKHAMDENHFDRAASIKALSKNVNKEAGRQIEQKFKSNRQPLCGGQDISVGVRDKILSANGMGT